MQLATEQEFLIEQLNEMFPRGLPEEVARLKSSWVHGERVYREMLTQVPPDVRETIESLRDLHSIELGLTLAAIRWKGSGSTPP
jgi:hypothetical protein